MKRNLDSIRSVAFHLFAGSARVQRVLDRELSNVKGISFSEYQILAALKESHGGALTRVGLAGLVRLTPSAVTRALRPLEKIGLVETVSDERDARRSLAMLTDGGLEFIEEATSIVNDALLSLSPIAELPKAEREQIITLLKQLSQV